MGNVTFQTTFSGGAGDLYISNDETNVVLHFDQKDQGPKKLDLSFGDHILSVKGVSPVGVGGNIALKITGDIPNEIESNFPAGHIPPHNIAIFVTQ